MKALSIRDIIGPVMIGPSSSHTAGALRIALMCRRLLNGAPVRAAFKLYGSFAHTYQGHGTDRALVGGMLGFEPDDMRIRDSFALAEEAGLSFEFVPMPDDVDIAHPNTVDIEATDASGAVTTMRGESIGGGAAVISRLNGIDVHLTGEYHSIVVKQLDRRGVLAHIATCLNVFDVNIATTRLFRKKKGDIAYTVMQTDDEIDEAIAAAIMRNEDILDVRIIKSDRASESNAPVHADDATHEVTGFGADMSVEEAEAAFEQLDFANGAELLAYCEEHELPLSDAICHRERAFLASQGIAVDDTKRYLHHVLDVMRASVRSALDTPTPSMGGLIGGEGRKLVDLVENNSCLADPMLAKASAYAMAVLETNASMGRIVAAPTAGSSGVLPAALLACQESCGLSDERLERGLANAAAIGYLITRNATVSGAEGGCQAEVGAASAMAASAIVELSGGTPRQCLSAASNALTSLMGLVCDPVGGLVEVPCQKRNAAGVACALASAQIALAGVENLVDFDQTVDAMHCVGRSLPFELRESALGGLAATPAACEKCAGAAKSHPARG